jgi:hypothetical protein
MDVDELEINFCSELECPKNDKRGVCTITGCILIPGV